MTRGLAMVALAIGAGGGLGAAGERHAPAPYAPAFSSGRASFALRFNDEITSYRVLATFLLPGEPLALEVPPTNPGGSADPRTATATAGFPAAVTYEASAAAGTLRPTGARSWEWEAPTRTGLYPITVNQRHPADSITLNVFVMVPFDRVKDGHLNGYRIGGYPTTPLRGLPIYRPPRGFVEVTRANRATAVSPHFRLEQFLCKQRSGWPKYLVLSQRLLLKLEVILARANEAGYPSSTFHVMSGYRTPYYNRAIGNARYSRHVWGDAADIFIDENPRDGIIDDLNGDGRIDVRDAAMLYDIIDQLAGEPWYTPFIGGLARYRTTANHGPFVHVDARGFRARWAN